MIDDWPIKPFKSYEQYKIENPKSFLSFNDYWMVYMNDPLWIKRKDIILERDRYICRVCGRAATQAHHCTYKNRFEESPEDLAAVCRDCNHGLKNDPDLSGKSLELIEENKRALLEVKSEIKPEIKRKPKMQTSNLFTQELIESKRNEFEQRKRKEYDQEFREYMHKELDRTLDFKSNANNLTNRKRIKSDYTSYLIFIKYVVDLLSQSRNMSLTKKELAERIEKLGILKPKDKEIHPDGQKRFYKSLCRTQRYMIKFSMMLKGKQGLWILNPSNMWKLNKKQKKELSLV